MRRNRRLRARKSRQPKMKLGLPDLDQARSAVLNSLRSPESQRGYRHSIDEFIAWYCSEPRLSFNKTVVTRYRIHLEARQLAPRTINVQLAAVRRLAYEAADAGLLSPELAAGIRQVEGAPKLGVVLGNWLTAEEARRLWQALGTQTLKAKRNQALLAVLLGCGLRRRELAELTVDLVQRRADHRAIVDLVGKRGHNRTVPAPSSPAGFLRRRSLLWFMDSELRQRRSWTAVPLRLWFVADVRQVPDSRPTREEATYHKVAESVKKCHCRGHFSGCLLRVRDAVKYLPLLRNRAIREIKPERPLTLYVQPRQSAANLNQKVAALEVEPIVNECRHSLLGCAH